jgi:hypothetical protein
MVHLEEMDNDGDMIENIYPSWILGFISINNEQEAVIQCSLKPLCWDDVEKTLSRRYNWELILTFCL